jgi:hypothetical protein
MKIYTGICKSCTFQYAVADRVPNYCPECGAGLWMRKTVRMDIKAFKAQQESYIEAERLEVIKREQGL